jgi:hypothetical protein
VQTQKELERERQNLLGMASQLFNAGDASGYQKVMVEVFRIDRELNQRFGKPIPRYPYRTVQGTESTCQRVNDFIAQCDDTRWKSSECRRLLDAINGCANSELILTDGETSPCKPAYPSVEEAAAILDAECSKLMRGADGQNPCDRQPPPGAAQVIVERCKPGTDVLTTPDGGGGEEPGKAQCPKGDLEKFLSMALPAKDYAYIYQKLGGPRPPDPRPGTTGTTGPTGSPHR